MIVSPLSLLRVIAANQVAQLAGAFSGQAAERALDPLAAD